MCIDFQRTRRGPVLHLDVPESFQTRYERRCHMPPVSFDKMNDANRCQADRARGSGVLNNRKTTLYSQDGKDSLPAAKVEEGARRQQ